MTSEATAMTLIKEKDYGTKSVHAVNNKMVTLEIDGQEVTVPEGTSIMSAAAELGIKMPKLCATDSLDPFGSCRLCLSRSKAAAERRPRARRRWPPASRSHTQNDRLARMRKGVMELYISDHPLDCLTCAANGDCELQDMAGAVGLREVRYGYDGENHVFARSNGEANALWQPKDTSNPYFQFEPSKCIVCSRCVRACEEVQGTFALTIDGRGFASHVSASMDEDFLASECVSCGACVQACPTATLIEKSVVEQGQPEHSVVTTCAYCGVGCSFKAEMQGEQVVRMVPYKDGGANEGHSCVKGRFAFGYATHKDRVLTPMIREKITDPWQVVSWDEAIKFAADRFKAVQAKYGRGSIGGITSSRTTNEEVYVVQRMVRAAFGNNNVDTCARVCHSPTGYGLKQTFGKSAGTQDFKSVDKSDVIMVIGANPTDGHPVFASRMKKRLREGAKLIVVDPRRTDIVRSPHVEADYHLQLRPSTNVAVMNAIDACHRHRGHDRPQVRRRALREGRLLPLGEVHQAIPKHSPEAHGADHRRSGRGSARRRPPVRDRRQRGHLLRPRRHRAQPGLDHGHGHGQHRHGDRQHRPRGRRREPAARPEQRAGLVRHGLVPARVPRLPPRLQRGDAQALREGVEGQAQRRARPAHSQHVRRSLDGSFKGIFVHGEDIAQSDPNTHHVEHALESHGHRRRAGPVPERDGGLRARVLARHLVPREGRHLHQRRTPHEPRAPGDEGEAGHGRVGHRLPHRHRHGLSR